MRAGFPALGRSDHSAAIIAVLSTGRSAIRKAGKSISSSEPAAPKTKLPENLPDRLPGIIQRSDFVKNGLTVCTPGQCYDLFTCCVALFLILVIFAS